MSEDEEKLTGHVIVAARELEQMFRRAGSTAAGLHDATDEFSAKLSADCLKNLRFIASVRNKLAHGEPLDGKLDLARFDAAVGEVAAELAAFVPADQSKIHEVDDEFMSEVRKKLRLCGLLPGLNVIYFCALLLHGLLPAARMLLLTLFFLIGAAVTVGGIIDGDPLRTWIGTAFLLLYWSCTLFLGITERGDKVRWWLYSVPVVSVLYLLRRARRLAGLPEIIIALLPLAASFYGADRLAVHDWRGAAIAFGGAWLWGAVAVAARRKSFF